MKKILIISLVILVAAGAVLTGYYLRPKPAIVAQTGIDQSGATLPDVGGNSNPQGQAQTASATPTTIGDIQIDSYSFSSSTINAVTTKGKIISFSIDGNSPATLSPEMPNYLRSVFSPDGNKILISIGGGNKEIYSIFDVKTKGWTRLPSEYQNVSWSADSSQLSAIIISSNGSTIITTDSGLKKKTTQLTLSGLDFNAFWSSSSILIADRPTGLASGNILAFNTKTKALSSVVEDIYGAEFIIRPDGKLLLFKGDPTSQKGGRLFLLNKDYQIDNEFNFTTLPSKCVFGDIKTNKLYCAIPKDQNAFTGETLPDSYYKKSVYTTDKFYVIDLENGSMTTIDGPQNIDAIKLSINNNRLYYIDRHTNKLNYIQL